MAMYRAGPKAGRTVLLRRPGLEAGSAEPRPLDALRVGHPDTIDRIPHTTAPAASVKTPHKSLALLWRGDGCGHTTEPEGGAVSDAA